MELDKDSCYNCYKDSLSPHKYNTIKIFMPWKPNLYIRKTIAIVDSLIVMELFLSFK